MLYRIPGT